MVVVKAPDNTREELLTHWVKCHQKRLLNLCYMVLQDHELARDAVQETFLKAYQAMGSFRNDSNELTWLTKIALNICRNIKRSAWARHEKRDVTPEDIVLTAPDGFHQDAIDLANAIMQLPDKYKEVVMLYYFQRMTMEDIAHVEGTTKSLISRRIHKAHTMLHGILGKEYLYG